MDCSQAECLKQSNTVRCKRWAKTWAKANRKQTRGQCWLQKDERPCLLPPCVPETRANRTLTTVHKVKIDNGTQWLHFFEHLSPKAITKCFRKCVWYTVAICSASWTLRSHVDFGYSSVRGLLLGQPRPVVFRPTWHQSHAGTTPRVPLSVGLGA